MSQDASDRYREQLVGAKRDAGSPGYQVGCSPERGEPQRTSARDLTHRPGMEKITPGRGSHLSTGRSEGTEGVSGAQRTAPQISEEGLLRDTQGDRRIGPPCLLRLLMGRAGA